MPFERVACRQLPRAAPRLAGWPLLRPLFPSLTTLRG